MIVEQVSLHESGFVGQLFLPDRPKYAVIVATGSDGGLTNASYIAERFADDGLAALALAYFRIPGLNNYLSMIPLEYMEKAVVWLKERTKISNIAAYGVSKGAEYVLSAAVHIPAINCVVAVVPNYYVAEGIGARKSRSGASSWSLERKPLPYAPIPGGRFDLVKAFLRDRQFSMKRFYEQAEQKGIPEEALIPVENSNARILLLSSGRDSVWPSQSASNILIQRLRAACYQLPYYHATFPDASHVLEPIAKHKENVMRLVMKAERNHPEACKSARNAAFDLALCWILQE